MQAQDLAINLKDGLASFVHDGRVFTDMEELLADHVAHRVISLCGPTSEICMISHSLEGTKQVVSSTSYLSRWFKSSSA